MVTSVSCGTPCWVDDPTMSAQTPFRTHEIGTKVYTGGTAAAAQIPGGVFPGIGAMGVTAPGGMAVTVSAGYCCCPNSSSALQGAYIFGLLNAQGLTITNADPVNPRIDLVVAYVQDLGTPASAAYVAVITGNAASSPAVPAAPANSVALAQVLVTAGVTSVSPAAITDKRTYVVAPGGILPIQSAAAAPAVPSSQFMYTLDTNQLVHGTGTAGHVALPGLLAWSPQVAVKTSNTLAGSPGAAVTVLSVSVTSTSSQQDLEIYFKWAGVIGTAGLITFFVQVDGSTIDTFQVVPSAGTSYGTSGGSVTFYTSSGQGNTPAAGTHTVTVQFQATTGSPSTSDGIVASSVAATLLRVGPAPS